MWALGADDAGHLPWLTPAMIAESVEQSCEDGRPAQGFRTLSAILMRARGPRPGALAAEQALGRFFGYLEDLGYVETTRDPADRRARVVRRTAPGDRAVAQSAAVIAAREAVWRELVGARRYATFRSVLTAIAADSDVL